MAEKLSHGNLVAQIALNSKLTAPEVQEALEVLGSIVQATLQAGGEVDLLGVGTFAADSKTVQFRVGQSLQSVVDDPSEPVQISRAAGILGTVYDPSAATYSHKVNVC